METINVTVLLRVDCESNVYDCEIPRVDNDTAKLVGLGMLYEHDWCPDSGYGLSIWVDQRCVYSQARHKAYKNLRLDEVLGPKFSEETEDSEGHDEASEAVDC